MATRTPFLPPIVRDSPSSDSRDLSEELALPTIRRSSGKATFSTNKTSRRRKRRRKTETIFDPDLRDFPGKRLNSNAANSDLGCNKNHFEHAVSTDDFGISGIDDAETAESSRKQRMKKYSSIFVVLRDIFQRKGRRVDDQERLRKKSAALSIKTSTQSLDPPLAPSSPPTALGPTFKFNQLLSQLKKVNDGRRGKYLTHRRRKRVKQISIARSKRMRVRRRARKAGISRSRTSVLPSQCSSRRDGITSFFDRYSLPIRHMSTDYSGKSFSMFSDDYFDRLSFLQGREKGLSQRRPTYLWMPLQAETDDEIDDDDVDKVGSIKKSVSVYDRPWLLSAGNKMGKGKLSKLVRDMYFDMKLDDLMDYYRTCYKIDFHMKQSDLTIYDAIKAKRLNENIVRYSKRRTLAINDPKEVKKLQESLQNEHERRFKNKLKLLKDGFKKNSQMYKNISHIKTGAPTEKQKTHFNPYTLRKMLCDVFLPNPLSENYRRTHHSSVTTGQFKESDLSSRRLSKTLSDHESKSPERTKSPALRGNLPAIKGKYWRGMQEVLNGKKCGIFTRHVLPPSRPSNSSASLVESSKSTTSSGHCSLERIPLPTRRF